MKGCKTIDEAAKKLTEDDRSVVWEYQCMECGMTYYGAWHSKYSEPELCPWCDCDDVLFIKSIGWVKRRSLADLPESMYKKDYYNGLPLDLQKFNYYISDSGHVIMAVPNQLLEEAEKKRNLDMYECPVPVKYVLEKGYKIYKNHVIVDVNYGRFGIEVPDEYIEY